MRLKKRWRSPVRALGLILYPCPSSELRGHAFLESTILFPQSKRRAPISPQGDDVRLLGQLPLPKRPALRHQAPAIKGTEFPLYMFPVPSFLLLPLVRNYGFRLHLRYCRGRHSWNAVYHSCGVLFDEPDQHHFCDGLKASHVPIHSRPSPNLWSLDACECPIIFNIRSGQCFLRCLPSSVRSWNWPSSRNPIPGQYGLPYPGNALGLPRGLSRNFFTILPADTPCYRIHDKWSPSSPYYYHHGPAGEIFAS